MKPAGHFAQQPLVPSPQLCDARRALSLLVTPKLKCSDKPGDAAAAEGPSSQMELLEHEWEAQAGRRVCTGERGGRGSHT